MVRPMAFKVNPTAAKSGPTGKTPLFQKKDKTEPASASHKLPMRSPGKPAVRC